MIHGWNRAKTASIKTWKRSCNFEKLLSQFWHNFLEHSVFIGFLWRKRVGVEPTTRLAKSRIAGFEGREDHRIPFASAFSLQSLQNVRNSLDATGSQF
jgi:hypothetical protein